MAEAVITPDKSFANKVIAPSKINIGIALNMHPFPSEHDKIITRTKSNTDFVTSIE